MWADVVMGVEIAFAMKITVAASRSRTVGLPDLIYPLLFIDLPFSRRRVDRPPRGRRTTVKRGNQGRC